MFKLNVYFQQVTHTVKLNFMQEKTFKSSAFLPILFQQFMSVSCTLLIGISCIYREKLFKRNRVSNNLHFLFNISLKQYERQICNCKLSQSDFYLQNNVF
jgi:hypothetical protein